MVKKGPVFIYVNPWILVRIEKKNKKGNRLNVEKSRNWANPNGGKKKGGKEEGENKSDSLGRHVSSGEAGR